MQSNTLLSHSKSKRCSNVYVFLIAVYCAIVITPALINFVPTIVGALIISILLLAYLSKGIIGKDINTVFLCVSWIILILLLRLVGFSTAAWGNYFQQMGFFFAICIMLFINQYMDSRQKNFLAISIVSIITFNLIDNIRLNSLYPDASVHVIRPDWYPELIGLNIGSTQFSTMLCLFFGCTLMIALKCKQRKHKLLFSILCCFTAYYIIFNGMRATVILMLIFLFCAMLYVYNQSKYGRNKYLGLVFLLIISFICLIFLTNILEFLRDIIPIERFQDRINDMIGSLKNGIEEQSFSGRVGLIKLSFASFVENPIFGIGDHRVEFSLIESSSIGGHSEFIDIMARYGIMGASLIILIISNSFAALRRVIKENFLTESTVILLMLIIFGFTKTIFYPEIGVIVFILLPVLPHIVSEEDNMEAC